ncbi:restriction endonuclease subunit S [Paraburkholderia phosphatilytica]|uniref:restriction endonuclease subunit S n=1 Tax=Paraburkholderia phosphatilytica TaxID=2282883 RepID=UPI000E5299A4|nr:restriction endonuclease subunit S [Paraburkholderia phosphatilytica]
MNRPLSPTAVFRDFVGALRDHGVPDAYEAALSMLTETHRGDLLRSSTLPISHAELQAIREQAAPQLTEILDWISVSDTARRRGETSLTPDIAQLLTDLVIEAAHPRAVVLQDPLCLAASRLNSAGVSVEQYCSGSDIPALCAEITRAASWTVVGGAQDVVSVKSNGFLPIERVSKAQANNDVAIATFPLVPGVSGGAHAKQLPYAASEELRALISAVGSSIRRLIALVPSSMLYRTGKAADFRNELLNSGRLEAVLELPSGVTPLATHQYSLLILRLSGAPAADASVFVMALPERPTVATRGRGRKIEVESSRTLARCIFDGIDDRVADSHTSRTLTREAIMRSGSLLPRMLLTASLSAEEAAVSGVRLRELVDIFRPSSMLVDSRGVGASLTTESIGRAFPYVRFVETTQDDTRETEQARISDTTAELQPGDIVMVAKGAVGAMGLVETYAGRIFVPNSCLVLRPKSVNYSEALYLFFKSRIGAERLRQIVTGSTVRNIRLSDLGELIVPLPSERACVVAKDALRVINDRTLEIQRLEEERARIFADAIAAT